MSQALSRIKPHIFSVVTAGQGLTHDQRLAEAVEANVRSSVSQLSHSSRLIENLVQQGLLKIAGSVLDLTTGKVSVLED